MGMKLETAEFSCLGTASKIVIDKDNTTIVDGSGDVERVKARVNQIKAERKIQLLSMIKKKLQERLAKLSGGVAVIKVGAASGRLKWKEKKDRVDDALSATRAAVEEGIVIGGGAALIRAAAKVKPELKVMRQLVLQSF